MTCLILLSCSGRSSRTLSSQVRPVGKLASTSLTTGEGHELQEQVLPRIKLSQKSILGNTAELADSSAHAVAFHRGLGTPLHPTSSSPFTKYIDEFGLEDFSKVAYAKDNFAVVANGASHAELSKWVGEFFADSPDTAPSDFPKSGGGQTKYYGGEERIAHDSGNNVIIAFPGSGSFTGGFFKPEISVLSALLGGQSSIKWSSGFSLLSKATADYPRVQINTTHHTYSDAGLLCISISGSASQIRNAASGIVSTLKGVAAGEVSKEDIKKAVARAKFQALESGQAISTGIELTGAGLVTGGKAFQIDEVGKSIEGVTEDQVKKVSQLRAPLLAQALLIFIPRPLNHCLMVKQPFRRWVTCGYFLLRRKLGCTFSIDNWALHIVYNHSIEVISMNRSFLNLAAERADAQDDSSVTMIERNSELLSKFLAWSFTIGRYSVNTSWLHRKLCRHFLSASHLPLTVKLTMAFAWKAAGLTYEGIHPDLLTRLTARSYNRYLAVAARVVRRSLKEQPRLQAERRGEMDLRFAKWQVSGSITSEEIGN